MDVPRYVRWVEFAQAKSWIEHEPQKILDDPEYLDAGDHPRFRAPREMPHEQQREMEEQGHAGKDPGVVAGQWPAPPEDVQQPVIFDTPGRQVGGPPRGALDLDFHVGE